MLLSGVTSSSYHEPPRFHDSSLLKLTGDGVAEIRACKVDFVDAVLDVSELRVPPGDYRIVNAKELGATNLKLAAGADESAWRIKFDAGAADVILTRNPSGRSQPAPAAAGQPDAPALHSV